MRQRIVICLALLLCLYVIGDATALWCLQRSTSQLSALADSQRIQVMRADLAAAGVRIQRDLLAAHAAPAAAEELARDGVARLEQAVARCGECHHTAPVDAELGAIRTTFANFVAAVQQLTEAPAEDAPAFEHAANQIAAQLVAQATDIADRAYHHLDTRSAGAAADIRRAWYILCGTLVAAMAVGAAVAWHLHRRITRPVAALLAGVERVRTGGEAEADGVTIQGDPEFRSLGEAFNRAYTDLAATQERMIQAEKMAAVGKLAAGIAHEVGNPLASISSVAQIMRRRCNDPEHMEKLDLIMQHIGRASRIVRELLTFSRPVYERKPAEVNLSTVLDRTVALLRFDKRAGSAAIECRYRPELRVPRGDPDRLMTVFTNVMLNAFDAMALCRNGDARLVISAEESAERIAVSFADNGPGMSREEIHNAFEPFFTTKEPGSGTGLGLWVCYQVVQKHGGAIRIENKPPAGESSGTHVTIELPRSAADDQLQAAGAAHAG